MPCICMIACVYICLYLFKTKWNILSFTDFKSESNLRKHLLSLRFPFYRSWKYYVLSSINLLSFKFVQGSTANYSLYLSLLAPRLVSFPFYHAASPVSSWKKSLPWRMDKRQLGNFRRKKRAWAKVVRKHKVATDLLISIFY